MTQFDHVQVQKVSTGQYYSTCSNDVLVSRILKFGMSATVNSFSHVHTAVWTRGCRNWRKSLVLWALFFCAGSTGPDALEHFSGWQQTEGVSAVPFLYMLGMRMKIADALGVFHFSLGGFLVCSCCARLILMVWSCRSHGRLWQTFWEHLWPSSELGVLWIIFGYGMRL